MDDDSNLLPSADALLGFNLELPEQSLKTAVVFSLLSVWVLVGLFHYLNRYTKRGYFTIWTGGWLFYALFLTIRASSENFQSAALMLMFENWCIATAAMLMFWGSFSFMEWRARQQLMAAAMVFVSIWSYVAAYQFPGELWIQIPAFVLLGIASSFTASAFFKQSRKGRFVGTGMLTFGFALWALYLVCYPFLQFSEVSLSAGFMIATVLQLFIATSMIVLVLEETKTALRLREAEVQSARSKAEYFEVEAASRLDRYQQLFQNASDAILIVEVRTLEIVDANRAAHALFNATELPPGGKNLREFVTQPQFKGVAEEWLKHLSAVGEVQLKLANGLTRRVSIRGGAIRYEGQEAYQLFLTELSEREKMQGQLRQAEKLAALGQMISGVAHELNNPLAAIQGYSELMLMDDGLPQASRQGLECISTESARAVKMLKNFLSFAQVDSTERERISINALVESVAESRRSELVQAGCDLRLELSANGPHVVGVGDHLRQVLHQLISNAKEAMAEQSREKRIIISTEEMSDEVLVRVEDSGPGVPEEIAPRIFEPFFTTKLEGQGTGLGLSIVHGLIGQHRGKVWFERRPLGGAVFMVKLPLARAGDTLVDPPAETKSADAAHILIVDDEEALGSLLQEMLGLSGHNAEISSDPREALQKLSDREFDIIISDFRMPQMNGADFFEEAVKINQKYSNRFAFITGDAVHEAARDFFAEHRIPKLLKPFQLCDVENIISKVLASAGSIEAAASTELKGNGTH